MIHRTTENEENLEIYRINESIRKEKRSNFIVNERYDLEKIQLSFEISIDPRTKFQTSTTMFKTTRDRD